MCDCPSLKKILLDLDLLMPAKDGGAACVQPKLKLN